MKKVLQVITLSDIGGAQNVVYDIIRSLNHNFYFYVVCAPGGKFLQWIYGMENVEVIEIPYMKRNISLLSDFKVLIKLISIIRQKKIDIVHCHSSKAGILGRLAAFICRVPKRIFTVHGWGINQYQSFLARNFYRFVEFVVGMMSTDIVCVSYYDETKGKEWKITSPKKTKVIYNGIEKPTLEIGKLKKELGIKENDILIGTVARITEQKNPIFTAEVIKEVVRRKPNVKFVWLGTGVLERQLKLFVEQNGMEKCFFILGCREDAKNLLGDMEIFILLSRWEGLPISIIEAMFAECPVVASDVGGVSELVTHKFNGELVYKFNIDEACIKILGLLENENRMKEYGQNGKTRASTLFKLNQMISEYQKIYIGKNLRHF